MASFYENQQAARRQSGLLAFYFGCAVVLIVLAVDAVLFAADRYLLVSGQVMGPAHRMDLTVFLDFARWLTSAHGWIASLITAAVLVAGSMFKTMQIGSSGDKVAIMAGGTWVDLNTQSPRERQLLNVVEEMAIASGIKPPRVYLMREESGINAFVAGLTPNETALAVTQGALDLLNRDELQGVIGHEFSHILNSDMRINVRMIGLLAGILMIGQIGRILMDTRSRYSSDRKSNNALPLIGFGLWLIGAIGLFFGQLIKAALSRQREFLADASSVQFTRNPLGIGGALIKIRDAETQSYLASRHAGDISHMCFGEVMRYRFNALFATHPPLEERIRAIDPALEKHLRQRTQTNAPISPAKQATDSASASFAGLNRQDVKQSVGTLTPEQIQRGERMHQQIPDALLRAAHEPALAALLIHALVLAEPQHDNAVNQALKQIFSTQELGLVMDYRSRILAMPPALRLPLFDITVPALQRYDETQQAQFIERLHAVINADKHFTLSECAFVLLIDKYLHPSTKPPASINSTHKVEAEIVTLFSALSFASKGNEQERRTHFERAMRCLGINIADTDALQIPTASSLKHALQRLNALSPLLKNSLIDNAVDMVIADRQIHITEMELLRAFSEMLDCPMPPVDPSLLVQ